MARVSDVLGVLLGFYLRYVSALSVFTPAGESIAYLGHRSVVHDICFGSEVETRGREMNGSGFW